jgi:hypothetical protein
MIVFVGPTLPAGEVAALVPRATVAPPAAVGDVLTAAGRRIRRIVLVDGYFERMAAVWHKEILIALERGIEVWGVASMGAIRAAELARFGMRGAGVIYRGFASGRLVADDEVAVAHLPVEYGYRATSDALVNLRDGLAGAARSRVIQAPTAAKLVELARARFYRERSWTQLVIDGAAAGLPHRQLDALAVWQARVRPDRKAADARMLLRKLARLAPRRPRAISVPRTWALGQLVRWLDAQVEPPATEAAIARRDSRRRGVVR